ncbi:MAG: HvfC/BufC family peptide modification chaperone [bacterium]
MSLEKAQREFIQYLYTPKPAEAQQSQTREWFWSEDKPDPGNGLKIYRRNLVFGMLEVLKDTYSFTRELLGENNFNFLGREYIYTHPSENTDLTLYGGGFGGFLAGRPEIAAWPYLADVARLEWARDRAFYAPPEAAPAPNAVSVRLKTSVTLIASPFKILGPWEIFTEGGLAALAQDPFEPEPEFLVVWAHLGEPQVAAVSPTLAGLIQTAEGKDVSWVDWSFLEEKGWVTEGR